MTPRLGLYHLWLILAISLTSVGYSEDDFGWMLVVEFKILVFWSELSVAIEGCLSYCWIVET
jgi:hypothetical protein